MVKVSVIVPVYNAESYIGPCLESLVNQTLDDVEIIIVNDGSTDSTVKKVEKYIKNHSNIKLFNKENGGQSSARNYGLKYAKGEYISFIDGDDYIELDMLSKLYNRCKKDKLDICLCAINYVYDTHVEKYYPFLKEKITPNEYIITNPCPWNKLYKHELLKKNHFAFPEGIIYEDYSVIPRIGLWTDKIGYINECLYNYIIHDNSTMNIKKYNTKINSIFLASELLYDYFDKSGNLKKYYSELEHLFIHHLLYSASLRFYSFKKYEELKKISKIMHEKFPNWKKNATYKTFKRKDKIILNLFYYNQIWLLNIFTGIKKIFK